MTRAKAMGVFGVVAALSATLPAAPTAASPTSPAGGAVRTIAAGPAIGADSGSLRLAATGQRLGRKASFTLRGADRRTRDVRRTVAVKRSRVVAGLPRGTYRVTARPIRSRGKTSLPYPRRTTIKVTRASTSVGARFDTCTQKTVRFSSKLVPSCGVMWGAVANAFSARPGWPEQGPLAHRRYEKEIGRTFGLYSYYYSPTVDPPFPRPPDVPLLREPGRPRMLLAHWKVAQGMPFADVVAGKADDRIDRQAAYLKANFPEKLFLSIQFEAEWQVAGYPDPAQAAKDYARMYRYVVDRMRQQGVKNVIWTLVFGGYAKWATQPWFDDLYPGDAYVDWIGWNPYSHTAPGGPDFAGLLNSTGGSTDPAYPGMYDYLTRRHPGKPLMLSELGIAHDRRNPDARLGLKAGFYQSVGRDLHKFPALKAIVNFDAHRDVWTGRDYDIGVLSDPDNRRAFRQLSRLPSLVGPPA